MNSHDRWSRISKPEDPGDRDAVHRATPRCATCPIARSSGSAATARPLPPLRARRAGDAIDSDRRARRRSRRRARSSSRTRSRTGRAGRGDPSAGRTCTSRREEELVEDLEQLRRTRPRRSTPATTIPTIRPAHPASRSPTRHVPGWPIRRAPATRTPRPTAATSAISAKPGEHATDVAHVRSLALLEDRLRRRPRPRSPADRGRGRAGSRSWRSARSALGEPGQRGGTRPALLERDPGGRQERQDRDRDHDDRRGDARWRRPRVARGPCGPSRRLQSPPHGRPGSTAVGAGRIAAGVGQARLSPRAFAPGPTSPRS